MQCQDAGRHYQMIERATDFTILCHPLYEISPISAPENKIPQSITEACRFRIRGGNTSSRLPQNCQEVVDEKL